MQETNGLRHARGARRRLARSGSLLAIATALVVMVAASPTGAASAQPGDQTNVAGLGTATQSSTYPGPDRGAELAIDGNTAGRRADRSMTHTNKELNPWWQVELADKVNVGEVTVWNRTDGSTARLSNFWVLLSDQPFASNDLDTLINDPNVTAQHITAKPSPSATLRFNAVPARFVRVQLEGTNFLSLAEVEIRERVDTVFPFATQSSMGYGGDATRALDGDVDGNYFNGSVTHTAPNDKQPWLNVELSGEEHLRAVEIWHRTDARISRNDNLTVKASATSSNACAQDADYVKQMRRNGRRANRLEVGPHFQLGTGNEAFPIKSICITKTDRSPLSIAEVVFHYGTRASDGDDTFTAHPDEMYAGWIGPQYGYGGNDTYTMYATRYGNASFRDALRKGFIPGETNQGYQIYQRHHYGGVGDDVFNMGFPVHVDDDEVRMGHHVYGGIGRDTFNFLDVNNVRDGLWVFGRIDDFEVDQDTLQIDGHTLDLNNLPDNVRLVTYTPENAANFEHAQYWLLITSSQGGHIFYALEGSRYNPYNPDRIWAERHFIREIPDLSELTDTPYENTIPYVPASERRGLNPEPLVSGDGIGTAADEWFTGGIHHGTGTDSHVFAGAGNDLVGLGPSEDTLFGEQGDDRLWGGTENDVVDGGSGNDYLEGNNGDDDLRGGGDDDELVGGKGDDLLRGDSGTNLNYWLIDGAWRNPYIRKDDVEEERLTNGESLKVGAPELFTVQDDDGTLDAADAAEQITYTHSLGAEHNSAVTLKGVIPVRNDTTGATANAYQIEVVYFDYPEWGNLPSLTAWVFDVDGFAKNKDVISPNGTFQPLDTVAFTEVARLAQSDNASGGNDVFVFDDDAGTDTVIDFEVGIDTLQFPARAQGNLTVAEASGATMVSYENTAVILKNVAIADFSEDDIVFE